MRCPPFQVVSGEALRCRQSPICAGSARLIWAHLPFCALASSRPGAWFRVRTDARMIIRADLDWADIEVIRFVEPAPLDRGEAWRRLGMHVGHRLLLPPGILGTWIRVGSGGRVCAVRVRRVAPAVVSLVHPDNVRSQRVAERGGAKVEREMVLRGLPARV